MKLPEPEGIVVGEERGYSDWFHVIAWKDYHMSKGTKFYTESQMHEMYKQGLEDAKVEIHKAKITSIELVFEHSCNHSHQACEFMEAESTVNIDKLLNYE